MIFISYRRDDARFPATFLASRLKDLYGTAAVFIDFDDLPAGRPWPHHLETALRECRVVLALVGKDWNTPRLRDPDDWVRKEVCTGIREGKTVIVLKLDNAPIPPAADLPPDCELATLHTLQNLPLRALGDYAADFAYLCRHLERELKGDLTPRTGSTAPHQVPPPVPDFTGRVAEFEAMAASLERGGTVMIAAARGIGGAGKTELAKAVAARVRDRFPAGQLFVDLRGVSDTPTTPVEAMRQAILAFHPDTKLPDTADALLPLYRTTLANAGPVLVVLDNAKDKAQVKELVTVGPPAGFIVTSRSAIRLDGVKPVELEQLDPAEALALLRGIVGPGRGTDAELAELAGLCTFLPLALRVAGNFLVNDPIETVPEYLAKLRAERLKWLTDDETDVKAVLALSARQLIRDDAGRAERWQMLSVFPADFDEPAAAAVMGLPTDAARPDLRDLLARGLVQFDDKTRRFRLHDLLRAVARSAFECVPGHPSQASSEKRIADADRRFAEHYQQVLAKAEDLYNTGGGNVADGLAMFDHEAANIRHGFSWAKSNMSGSARAVDLCGAYPKAGAQIIALRMTGHERIDWWKVMLGACQKLRDRQGEGYALGKLGTANKDLGNAKIAITFHERSLEIARELCDRMGEGYALGGLGNAHSFIGNIRKAIDFHEQDLAISRERRDRRGEEVALSNLGLAYADLGDAKRAITFHEQALAISREIGDRRAEGQDLSNLGRAHADLGDTRTAIELYKQRLEIAREIGDRRGRAVTLGHLGRAYIDLGDAGAAIDPLKSHLETAREFGDRRREGHALESLGQAHAALGNTGEALSYYEKALTVTSEIEDRRGEAHVNWHMAVALASRGRNPEVIPRAQRSLAYFEEIGHSCVEAYRKTLAGWCNSAE